MARETVHQSFRGQPMININIQKSLGDFQISAKIGLESDGVIALFGRSGSENELGEHDCGPHKSRYRHHLNSWENAL